MHHLWKLFYDSFSRWNVPEMVLNDMGSKNNIFSHKKGHFGPENRPENSPPSRRTGIYRKPKASRVTWGYGEDMVPLSRVCQRPKKWVVWVSRRKNSIFTPKRTILGNRGQKTGQKSAHRANERASIENRRHPELPGDMGKIWSHWARSVWGQKKGLYGRSVEKSWFMVNFIKIGNF